MKKISEIDNKLLDKIISVAYGDAGLYDRIKIYFLSKRNIEISNLLNEYQKTAGQLKKLESENCPDEIINKVYSEIGMGRRKISIIERIQFTVFSKPVYSAVLVLVLLVISLFIIFKQPEPQQQYTQAEIKQAELQVKETIVFVSNIFKKTGENLNRNILPNEVGKPVQKGLNILTNILNGG